MRRGAKARSGALRGSAVLGLAALALGGCDRAPRDRVVASVSELPEAGGLPESAAAAVLPPPAPSSSAPPTPAPATSSAVSVPPVTVENIGMHIGGGPNDADTKAPIGTSVAPHFDALRACFAQVDDPTRGGDFGVDLLIPAAGGRAAVSHPRTNLRPDAFVTCVVSVFEGIDFARPRTGRTTVSYALRFTPGAPSGSRAGTMHP